MRARVACSIGWWCWAACPEATAPPPAAAPKQAEVQAPTSDPQIALEEARAALTVERYQDAIRVLGPVIASHPDRMDARVMLAGAYLGTGESSKALAETDRALERAPQDESVWIARGAALYALGRLAEAVAAFTRAAEIDPTRLGAHLDLAVAQGRLGDGEGQAVTLAKLARIQPENPAHLLALARNLTDRGRAAEARPVLEGLLERHPREAQAHLMLAVLDYDAGETRRAMDRADAAKRLEPALTARAADIFRAAFYVGVSAALTCKAGARPWSKEAVEAELEPYRVEGLEGAESFYELDRRYGPDAEVAKRVASAAEKCKAP